VEDGFSKCRLGIISDILFNIKLKTGSPSGLPFLKKRIKHFPAGAKRGWNWNPNE
jgi:hypothetical protein